MTMVLEPRTSTLPVPAPRAPEPPAGAVVGTGVNAADAVSRRVLSLPNLRRPEHLPTRYGDVMTDAVVGQRPTLEVMAAAYAAVVAERQLAFDALVAEATGDDGMWSADLTGPTLTLGGRTFAAALLGSAAEEDRSWLWGWANPAFGEQHPATLPTLRLRGIGAEFDVPELTTASLPLGSVHDSGLGTGEPGDPFGGAHTLAVVATGLLGAAAYYAGGYDGGAAFLAVTDPSIAAPAFDPTRVPQVIGVAIDAFPHHHRLTVETYLGHHGLTAERLADGLLAHLPGDRGLIAFGFDGNDRLTQIETELADA